MAETLPPVATYTVDIPGIGDIIRIPLPDQNDVELRRQRIERMKTAKHPYPEAIAWIPSVINTLDDAQDLLFVALTLGKPLLRRLPTRFLPGLGWVLLANDLLNLATLVLGFAMTGGSGKRIFHHDMDILNTLRTRGLKKVPAFLSKTNWLGFTLQAGQVLESLTGYGLCLGPLMGMMSDAVWGIVRKVQGADIVIRTPPGNDIISKSARFIIQANQEFIAPDMLSDQDHALVTAAKSVAVSQIIGLKSADVVENRFNEAANMDVPLFSPWQAASRRALMDQGIDPEKGLLHPVFAQQKTPKFSDLTRAYAGLQYQYQKYQKENFVNPDVHQKALQMMFDEAGLGSWQIALGTASPSYSGLLPWEKGFYRCIEAGALLDRSVFERPYKITVEGKSVSRNPTIEEIGQRIMGFYASVYMYQIINNKGRSIRRSFCQTAKSMFFPYQVPTWCATLRDAPISRYYRKKVRLEYPHFNSRLHDRYEWTIGNIAWKDPFKRTPKMLTPQLQELYGVTPSVTPTKFEISALW